MTTYSSRTQLGPFAIGLYRTYRLGRDVREIGSDTGGVDDIVERELVNERAVLEQERQGLRHD